MIEFEGILSDNCRKYIVNRLRKSVGIITAIVTIFFMVLLFIFGFVIGSKFLIAFSIPFGIIMVAVFPISIAFAITTKKDQQEILPARIYLDIEDETIGAENGKYNDEHAIASVKQIVDLGEWYDVKFSFGEQRHIEIVIQKDLITEGTIEEFEQLFEDKIVLAKGK